MAALEEAADQAGARLKALDKKGEKAALQAERQALEQQLSAGEDAATGLSLAVSLLVQRVSAGAASGASLCLTHTAVLSTVVCRGTVIAASTICCSSRHGVLPSSLTCSSSRSVLRH